MLLLALSLSTFPASRVAEKWMVRAIFGENGQQVP